MRTTSDKQAPRERIGGLAKELGLAVIGTLRSNETARGRTRAAQSPVQAVDGCLIYGADDYWWAYFVLQIEPAYEWAREEHKAEVQGRLERLYILFEGYELHQLVTTQDVDTDALEEIWLAESVHAPADAQAKEGYARKIAEIREAVERAYYRGTIFTLGVRLPDRRFQGSASNADPEDVADGHAIFGIKAEVNHRLVQLAREALDKIHAAGFRSARPVDQDEMLDLVLRSIWRGCPETPSPAISNVDPVYRANDLAWLGEENYTPYLQVGKVNLLDTEVWVSYLALATLPQDPVCPGNEYLWLLDDRGDRLDSSTRIKVIPAAVVASQMLKADAEAEGHSEYLAVKNGQAGQEEIRRHRLAIRSHSEHADTGRPTIEFTTIAAVTGPTRADVFRIVQEIVHREGRRKKAGRSDQGNGWVAATGLQTVMHNACKPGSKVRLTNRYVHRASPDSIAAGMPHVSNTPRSVGTCFGRRTDRERAPLFVPLNQTLQKGVDGATATVLVGSPGSGKTTVGIEHVVAAGFQGEFGLARDNTKGDLSLLRPPDGLAVQKIDFSDVDGGFNPGLFGATQEQRIEHMRDWMLDLCGAWQPNWHGVVHGYVKAEIQAHPDDPDYRRVIAAMKTGNATAQAIGEDLDPMADLSQGRACWGNQTQANELLHAIRPGLSIWTSTQWQFPTEGVPVERWTALQRFSVAGLSLQFLFGRQVSLDRNRRSTTFDDEADAILKLRTGASEINLLRRHGRSKGGKIVLSVHHWGDVSSDTLEFVSTVYAFRAESDDAAVDHANALGLNPRDPRVLHMLRNLGLEDGAKAPWLKGEAAIRLPDRSVVVGQHSLWWIGQDGLQTNSETYQHEQRTLQLQSA